MCKKYVFLLILLNSLSFISQKLTVDFEFYLKIFDNKQL